MQGFCTTARCFMSDEDGATAIEYGLVAALICIALLVAMTSFSGNLIQLFNGVSNEAGDALDNINDI
jgi:pilus assembly protein Flp/PilA